jgi:hypothetical protein
MPVWYLWLDLELIYICKLGCKILCKTVLYSNNVCACLGYHEWYDTNRIGSSCVASLKMTKSCTNIVTVSSSSTCGLALRSLIHTKCAPKSYSKLPSIATMSVCALATMRDAIQIGLVQFVLHHSRWLMHAQTLSLSLAVVLVAWSYAHLYRQSVLQNPMQSCLIQQQCLCMPWLIWVMWHK